MVDRLRAGTCGRLRFHRRVTGHQHVYRCGARTIPGPVLPKGNLPIEVRPSVLYNPATRSANFFVPGLIGILLQVMVIFSIALSLVRERERGTLEQLTMTPVTPLGLMVGKMIPYGVLAFLELCAILFVMRVVFRVPIHGNVLVCC